LPFIDGCSIRNLRWQFQKTWVAKQTLSNEIDLGAGSIIKGLHTPGHTPGSICLLLYEKNDLHLCFTGDTIFKGSAGRTDIGGNYTDLIYSIRELMKLPDSVTIMPGHGDSSTIGVERLENPFTKL
jgi:hydroxyacylglutathione hydrolase